jgi:hypothetical protein
MMGVLSGTQTLVSSSSSAGRTASSSEELGGGISASPALGSSISPASAVPTGSTSSETSATAGGEPRGAGRSLAGVTNSLAARSAHQSQGSGAAYCTLRPSSSRAGATLMKDPTTLHLTRLEERRTNISGDGGHRNSHLGGVRTQASLEGRTISRAEVHGAARQGQRPGAGASWRGPVVRPGTGQRKLPTRTATSATAFTALA